MAFEMEASSLCAIEVHSVLIVAQLSPAHKSFPHRAVTELVLVSMGRERYVQDPVGVPLLVLPRPLTLDSCLALSALMTSTTRLDLLFAINIPYDVFFFLGRLAFRISSFFEQVSATSSVACATQGCKDGSENIVRRRGTGVGMAGCRFAVRF